MRVDPHAEGLEQPGEVHGRGLALDVGVGGQDHLGDALGVDPARAAPSMRSCSGPMPSIGEIAPWSTW